VTSMAFATTAPADVWTATVWQPCLMALPWSAGLRLGDLPGDLRLLRAMIIAGLVVSALGVVLGAVTVSTP
jgi:hypothetical protein